MSEFESGSHPVLAAALKYGIIEPEELLPILSHWDKQPEISAEEVLLSLGYIDEAKAIWLQGVAAIESSSSAITEINSHDPATPPGDERDSEGPQGAGTVVDVGGTTLNHQTGGVTVSDVSCGTLVVDSFSAEPESKSAESTVTEDTAKQGTSNIAGSSAGATLGPSSTTLNQFASAGTFNDFASPGPDVASNGSGTVSDFQHQQQQGVATPGASTISENTGSAKTVQPKPLGTVANNAEPPTTTGNSADDSGTNADNTGAVPESLNPSIERYQYQKELGKGAVGTVWLAHDRSVERSVAIKKLQSHACESPFAIQRFVSEARVTGQLEHPGIVPIYEVGVGEDQQPFYSMKRLEGKELADEILEFHRTPAKPANARSLAFNRLLRIFIDVCNAVGFAHERGFVHRDLKPENVVVGSFGEAIVVDWGLAKRIEHERAGETKTTNGFTGGSQSSVQTAAGNSKLTMDGTIMGTPAYMSPEQAMGHARYANGQSDVFALGCMLYDILTGSAPFDGNTIEEVLGKVRTNKFEEPRKRRKRGVPLQLNAVVLKAMSRRPVDRYQSAQELAADVERYLAGEKISAFKEPIRLRAQRWIRNHHGIVVSTVIALSAICFLSVSAGLMLKKAHKSEILARISAESSRDAERKSKQQEAQAKHLAATQLREARKAADAWLLNLSSELQFYPGLEVTRCQLLGQAAEHYEYAANYEGSDTLLEAEAARSRLRLGDVRRLLGETDESAQTYRQSIEVFERLAKAHPGNQDFKLQLAGGQIGLALILIHQNETELAKDVLLAPASSLNELTEQAPNSVEVLNAHTRFLITRARMNQRAGKAEAAQADLKQAIRILEKLVIIADKPKFKIRLATCLEELGDALDRSRNWSESVKCFDGSKNVYQDLIKQYPHRPDFYDGLAIQLIRSAAIRREQGHAEVATQLYRKAIETYDQLAEALFGDHHYNENLAVTYVNLSQLLVNKINQRDDARELLASAQAEFAGLIGKLGNQPSLLRKFAGCSYTLGLVLAEQNQMGPAATELDKASRVLKHLTKSEDAAERDVREWIRCEVDRSNLLIQQGKRLAAADSLSDVIDRFSEDRRFQRDIALAYKLHGEAVLDSSDRASVAIPSFRQAISHVEAALRGTEVASQKPELMYSLARFLVEIPKPTRIDSARAVSICQRLIKQDKANPAYRCLMAGAFCRAREWDKALETLIGVQGEEVAAEALVWKTIATIGQSDIESGHNLLQQAKAIQAPFAYRLFQHRLLKQASDMLKELEASAVPSAPVR